jgi:hypothetical protein
MDPVTLIKVASTTTKLFDLVNGKELKDAISTIVGDIHVNAAKFALETTITAVNAKDRLNSAITHLETAHFAYTKIHSNKISVRKAYFDWELVNDACYKDAWACSVMALCYASLNERHAVTHSCNLAREAVLKQPRRAERPSLNRLLPPGVYVFGYLNPKNWTKSHELITWEEIFKLEDALEQAMLHG